MEDSIQPASWLDSKTMNVPPAAPSAYVLQSDDASCASERRQFDHWATRTESEKAQSVRRLIARMTLLQENGLREVHPDADDREIFLRAAAVRLGPDSVRRWTGFDAERA